jgi:hypothetical protein
MLTALKWNEESKSWQPCGKVDDGFGCLCDSYHDASLKLCTEELLSPIHVERLLALTAGMFLPVPDWHDVGNMPSFQAEADERTKRLTFVHEQDLASHDFRNTCITTQNKRTGMGWKEISPPIG